jgi:hypothetical protein
MKVNVVLIVTTMSHKTRSYLFLTKKGELLNLDMSEDITPDKCVSTLLLESLDIKYEESLGVENWVHPRIEDVYYTPADKNLHIVYTCIIPEESADNEELKWQTLEQIVLNDSGASDFHKEALRNFVKGGKGNA